MSQWRDEVDESIRVQGGRCDGLEERGSGPERMHAVDRDEVVVAVDRQERGNGGTKITR